MQGCLDVLGKLDVPCEVHITSAHRTPEATRDYVNDAEQRGCAVFIAAAGMAAHLAGVVAAQTVRPVIGVPMDAGPLKGMDALLSTVQMPAGVPVASVAIGSAGARNAAFLAAQMLGLADSGLSERLRAERKSNAESIAAKDRALQKKLRGG
ncbi:MAG: 5-(carboxyamino)imidazole ribonucleotide mutase [Gammaproteobacteria bacterium]